MMKDCKVNVLGTEYEIKFVDKFPEYLLEYEETSDALFSAFDRTIFVKNDTKKDITEKVKERKNIKNLQHEIMRALFYESGLSANTYGHVGAWADMRK